MVLSCVAAVVQAGAIEFLSVAHVAARQVVLADVSDLSRIPCALRAGATFLPIARIPPGHIRVVLSAKRLRERARALMPALAPWLTGGDAEILVSLEDKGRPKAAPAPWRCLIAKTDLRAGAIAAAADFEPSDCDPTETQVRKTYRYDAATGAVRLTRGLRAWEPAPFLPPAQLAAVLPGQELFVSATVGPVRVERQVEAVQPSPVGRAVFVKADDGAVFSAPGPGVAP